MTVLPQITIDKKSIRPNTIWYHQQDKPKPGGHFFEIKVDINSDAVKLIEKLTECNVENAKFCEKVKQLNDNICNSVQCVLDNLPQEMDKDWKVEWVFNTIDEVLIEDNQLIIKGQCSEALENY